MGGLFYSIGRIITLGNPKAKARINRVCEEKALKTIESAVVCAGAVVTGGALAGVAAATVTTSAATSAVIGACHTAKTGERAFTFRYVEPPRKIDKPIDYIPVESPVKITKMQQDELEKNASVYRERTFVFNDDVENCNITINPTYRSLFAGVDADAIDRHSNFVLLNLPQQTAAEHIQRAWFNSIKHIYNPNTGINYITPRSQEKSSVFDIAIEGTGVSVSYEDGRHITDISSDVDPKICEILGLPSPTLGDKRDVFELHDEAKEKVTTTQRGMNSSAVGLAMSTSMPKVYMNAATLIWRTYQHYRARKEVSRHDPYFENKGVVTYPEILNP